MKIMKICVLVKQVPDKNDEIKLNSENLSVPTESDIDILITGIMDKMYITNYYHY